MAHEIRDDPAAHRVELLVDGRVATFVDCEVRGDVWSLLHVETVGGFARQGLATELVAAVLARLRTEGRQVLPRCPFVRAYLAAHPADVALVPADRRAEFDLPCP